MESDSPKNLKGLYAAQLRGVSDKSVRVMTPIYRGIFRGFDVKILRSETLLS